MALTGHKASTQCFRGAGARAPPRISSCSRRTPVTCAARPCTEGKQLAISRRSLLYLAPLLPAVALPQPSRADGEAAVSSSGTYTDAKEGFSLSIPAGWEQAEGQLEGNTSFSGASGSRRTVAWFPGGRPASEVNVSITITNVSVEFTKLGSFGNVYAFGSNLVNQMDRSYLLRSARNTAPVQVAKLLDAEEKRGMYFVEYTVQKLPDPKRYFKSVVALSNNGYYNRLYTVTAQCLDEQLPEYGPVLDKIIASFQPPPEVTA